MNNLLTINGGKKITVTFEPLPDGRPSADPAEIKVRQIPVRDYDKGFALVGDEIAFAGFLADKPRDWALTLAPESLEAILAAGREVNEKGFFSSCQRHTELAQRQQGEMLAMMGQLPPEALKVMVELGQAKQRASALPTFSPGFVSPPRA
jgi:hypothetical protein